MKVAEGLEMLKIEAIATEMKMNINPTLIWDKDTLILVDTGLPGLLPLFREAIQQAGQSFDSLNMVILTHHDFDHIGSLANFVEALPTLKVLAHIDEKPYIQGDKRPLKLAKFETQMDSLPPEMKAMYEIRKAEFASNKTRVDITLTDGEELPYCGGITVIHTPGHTLGHICLYHKQSKTLIAGDMLRVKQGMLTLSSEKYNYDHFMNAQSLKKLIDYDIQNVICYHGGYYNDNVNARIKELLNEQN